MKLTTLLLLIYLAGCDTGIRFPEAARSRMSGAAAPNPSDSGFGYLTLKTFFAATKIGSCLDLASGVTDPEIRFLRRRIAAGFQQSDVARVKTGVERLAFWINAHNFAVLQALVEGYAKNPAIAVSDGGFAPLRRPNLRVGRHLLAPDWIAHGIIRGDFDHIALAGASAETFEDIRTYHQEIAEAVDARVLFALACGARSCPPFTQVYRGDSLEEALNTAARTFLADTRIGANENGVSAFFHWYAEDFSDFGGPAAFIATMQPDLNLAAAQSLTFDWSIRTLDGDDPDCAQHNEAAMPPQTVIPNGSEGPVRVCEANQTTPCGPRALIGQCRPGYQGCLDGQWGDCIDAIRPTIEQCNGLDDDCDGEIDNQLAIPLESPCPSMGVCSEAHAQCREGAWTCVFPAAFSAIEFQCDDLDNDCDGQVDEALTTPPDVSDCSGLGECATGAAVCLVGAWQCSYPGDVEHTGETRCDGLDNDCDGVIDEALPNCACKPGAERDCGTSVGTCRAGTQRCIAGTWTGCDGIGPEDERCDGLDNDCDGGVDDGVTNGCGVCGDPPTETCNGIDDDCDQRVDEGVRNACNVCGSLPNEVCNSIDDDCDGQIDEGVRNACGGCDAIGREVCNGLDDDCDGELDEDLDVPQDLTCPNRGVCAQAAMPGCTGSDGFGCVFPPTYQETESLCDFVDNDCDGLIDEGLLNQCEFCGPDPIEACNHLDDDCDGIEDEGCPIDPSTRPIRGD
jgi:hypothetical protein